MSNQPPASPEPAAPTFPAGFLMGASTAAHQVEGNNVNSNWWAIEHMPGTVLAEPSGDAADSYHRWPDDLDIVARQVSVRRGRSRPSDRNEPGRRDRGRDLACS